MRAQLHEHLPIPDRRALRGPTADVRVRRDDVAPDGDVLPDVTDGRQRHQVCHSRILPHPPASTLPANTLPSAGRSTSSTANHRR
jgi:hypothetical protein